MNLADPGTLKAFLGRQGIDARKGLGQHFLCSSAAVRAIVDQVGSMSGVLEIGPGPGVLTGPISDLGIATIAIELDERMIAALTESAPRVDVRKIDALHADLASILDELPSPRAVVSNLPYYITAALLTRVAEVAHLMDRAVLMMQREVADRVVAPAGNRSRGSLSVYLQSRFSISKVAQVPAGAFVPPPKVDSSVLRFAPKGEILPEEFFRFVRHGFSQPRKTLANNLSSGLQCERPIVAAALVEASLSPAARASDLEIAQWRAVWDLMGSP